ncbi:MAG TPA: universal stress protein [Longimicrobiales bacterium]
MYRNIMVPLDGSPFGEQALPVAIALARRSAARLHVVHVRTSNARPVRGRAGIHCDPERDYLNAMADRASEELDESVSFALLADTIAGVSYSNPPRRAIADVLETYVREHGIDLVVMTTHGRGGISRAWLGSVADSFIRQATAPVLLIRPEKDPAPAAGGAGRIRHILIPLDGSEAAEAVIGPAVRLGTLTGARYSLLRVVSPISAVADYGPPSAVFDDPTLSERRRVAVEYVSRLAERMSDDGFEVSGAVMIAPSAAAAITEYAEANGADAIAIGTRGLGGPRRMLLGSVADKVVRSTDRLVLVCNTALVAGDEAREEALEATAAAVV